MSVFPRSKRKMAWAINTKLGTHILYSSCLACNDPEVQSSRSVGYQDNPAWVRISIRLPMSSSYVVLSVSPIYTVVSRTIYNRGSTIRPNTELYADQPRQSSWVIYSVVTTTELSLPSWWLATIEPTPPLRCFTVFLTVFRGAVSW